MQRTNKNITWEQLKADVATMWQSFQRTSAWVRPRFWNVYGVPRGGVPIALLLESMYSSWDVRIVDAADQADVIVDDILDSGTTKERFAKLFPNTPFLTVYVSDKQTWLHFPFEKENEGIDENLAHVLEFYGLGLVHIEKVKGMLQNFTQFDDR